MGSLVVIVYLALTPSLFAACPPGEYKINELCCPMCHIGTVVKTHCTSTSSSNVCVPCVQGTYMDHPNGVTKCLKCTECDSGGGLLTEKECTYTSNAVCDCKPGYYCEKGKCDLCQPHKICAAGQYIKVQGTTKSDNKCEDCPAGHFSTPNVTKTCTAWTKCSELGQILYKEGTPTSDCICKDSRSRVALGSAIGFVVILLLLVLFSKKRNILSEEYHDSRQPVQETTN